MSTRGTPSAVSRAPRSGQSTAEYAIVLGVVLAALVGMQIYVRRGVNARLKDGSDSALSAIRANLGITTASTGDDRQYEPYYASSDFNVIQTTDRVEEVKAGGVVEHKGIREQTDRTGQQKTEAPQ